MTSEKVITEVRKTSVWERKHEEKQNSSKKWCIPNATTGCILISVQHNYLYAQGALLTLTEILIRAQVSWAWMLLQSTIICTHCLGLKLQCSHEHVWKSREGSQEKHSCLLEEWVKWLWNLKKAFCFLVGCEMSHHHKQTNPPRQSTADLIIQMVPSSFPPEFPTRITPEALCPWGAGQGQQRIQAGRSLGHAMPWPAKHWMQRNPRAWALPSSPKGFQIFALSIYV